MKCEDKRLLNIAVDKSHVKKTWHNGELVFQVSVPDGTIFRNSDIGGYCIYPTYVNEGTANKSKLYMPFALGIPLKIVKGEKSMSVTANELNEIFRVMDDEK